MIKKLTQFMLVPIVALALLTSCASFQNFQQFLGSPSAVQFDIATLGGLAKPHIPADAQAKIHQFALALNQAADLNLNQLFALLPLTTGSQNGDALIAAAKAYVTSVVLKYGHNNTLALAYAHAVANGLLANF